MTSVRSDIAVSGTPLRGREKSKKALPRVPLGRSTTSCLADLRTITVDSGTASEDDLLGI